MIPRKKIRLLFCTLCILFTFGNGGHALAGHIESTTEEQTVSTSLVSMVKSTVSLRFATSVASSNSTENVDKTSSANNTSNSTNWSDDGTTKPFMYTEASHIENTTEEITDNMGTQYDNASLGSTVKTTVYPESNTTVEFSNSTENIDDASSANNTSNSTTWPDETTTELNICKVPEAVSNLTTPIDQITEYSVNLIWSAPTLIKTCIQYYIVSVCDENNCMTANTTDEFYNVTNLSPCLTYTFNVSVVGDAGLSDEASTTANTSSIVPGAVSYLVASTDQITENSVYLTWSVPTLDQTCIQYYIVSVCDENNCMNANTTDEFYNVTNLSPCLTYTFNVSVVGDAGLSDEASTTANTSSIVPEAVSYLVASTDQITENSVFLTWSVPTLHQTCIQYYNVSTCYENNCTEATTIDEFYNVTSLSPCLIYTFIVSAVGDAGLSDEASTTANTSNIVPGAVDYLAAPTDQITKYSVYLTWSAPTSNQQCVQYYLVRTCYMNDCTSVHTTNTFLNTTSLTPCMSYNFTVSAIGDAGSSDYASTTANTSFMVPGAISNLTVPTNKITGYSMYLIWSAPTLNLQCLQYYDVNTCSENNCVKAYITDTFYNVSNLSPCLTYKFSVSAVGDAGSSDAVSTPANTSDIVPGAVSNLTAPTDQITAYSVYLNWSPPTSNFECVQYYNVSTCYENDCTEAQTTDEFYTVTSLNPCVIYTFTVRAVGDAGSSDAESTTASTLYIVPGEPSSMVIEPGEFSLLVSWNPPLSGSTCTRTYRVTVWDHNGLTETTSDTNITLTGLSACTNYTVGITPVSVTGGDGSFGTVTGSTQESVNDPPSLEIEEPEVTKSTISIYWRINRTMNACQLKTVLTTCNFTSTNGSGFVAVSNQQSEDDISSFGSSTNVTINITVSNLSPYSWYECTGKTQNIAGYSASSTIVTTRTAEDVPSAPTLVLSSVESSKFTLHWDKPQYLAGNLIEHEILLSWERSFLMPSSCSYNDSTNQTIPGIEGSVFEYLHLEATSYSNYTANIRAKTNAGWGDYSDYISFSTLTDAPGAVTNVTYLNTTNSNNSNELDTYLFWQLPCSLNGDIESFSINIYGIRDGFEDDMFNKQYNDFESNGADQLFEINFGELRAEYNYTFTISAKVVGISQYGAPASYNVIYPAGMPPLPDQWYMNSLKLDMYKRERTSSTAQILLPLFENTHGVVMYYAIMISEIGQTKYAESRFDILSGSWPNTTTWKEATSHTPIALYQATPIRWHPLTTDDIVDYGHLQAVKFMLGDDESCSDLSTASYCNGPLQPETQYQVRMRAFTNGGYRDSRVIVIKTKAEFNLGMVIGVVFGILFLGIITTMMLLIRKGVLQTVLSNILHPSVQSSPGPDPFTRKKFELHCQELIDNPGKLSNEFQLLQTLSVDLEMSANAAGLQTNKKKNRYINILPYDISRVKLDVVNNDPNTDYINASFIQGYSGTTEYIACQGPKEETTYDFWRMIYQYNVKVIVMVTQLVEKGKDKCHQYYPNTRENFEYEDMMIRCSTQLDFVFYTQRIISLQKGNIKRTIMHLHFKEWSDHGVPDDVHSMINFCQIVRKLMNDNKGLAVIHCSAGVGRTGTLIAIDVLLQQIKDNKKLDVFGTVYKMRQHRMNMVQTESQYAYIYNCTKQALNNPYPPKHYKASTVEPVYENVIKKQREITDSNTNLVNSAETLKRMSPSPSSVSLEPICEIMLPQRPIYTSQLSTLSLRYSKSSSAINEQIPSNLQIARYGSHEYPIFEPAPDSPLNKVNVDSFLDFVRPITIEAGLPRPRSINLDENTDPSIYGVRPNY